MTVEVKEIKETQIVWGQHTAVIRIDDLEITPDITNMDILRDPEGFAEFANSIWAALKSSQPPKPRKTRKDKHPDKENSPIRLETRVAFGAHPAQVIYGDMTFFSPTLKEALQKLDIALGTTTWRDKLCLEDADLVKAIEEA